MSIIFRYVVDQNIIELLIVFFDVTKNKTASGLADIILSEINKWEIGNKIICQIYDGSLVRYVGRKIWCTISYKAN